MKKMRHFLVGAGLFLSTLVPQAPGAAVTNTSPRAWSAADSPGTAVTAMLDSAPTGILQVVLQSAWRGKRAGSVSTNGAQLVFTPAGDLLRGEPLDGSVSGPGTAFTWHFQTASLSGSATFTTNVNSVVINTVGAARFRNLALADINGDDALDIVAPGWNSNAVLLDAGTPGVATTYLARAIQDVAAGDFNADGQPDLILGCATQAFAVAINTGGAFAGGTVQTIAGVTGPIRQVTVSDLNGDGYPDAVAIAETSGHVIPLLNDGSGNLAAGTPVACTPPLYGLGSGDLNGDGYPDAVAVGPAGYVAVLMNDGTGAFGTPTGQVACAQTLYACRIADFDQDGRADIAAAGAEGVIVLGTWNGSAFSFAVLEHTLSLPTLYGLAAGDCDGNGKPDLVVCGADTVAVLLRADSGFLSPLPPIALDGETTLRDVEMGDKNGDGRLDVVTCGFLSGKTYVLWNTAQPGILVLGTNGAVIASGETPPSFDKGADFGAVPIFSVRTNRFPIVNPAEGPLLITGTALSGVSNGFMTVIDMPEMVSGGATSFFGIVFAPQTTGLVTAVLSISNNSPVTVSNGTSPYLIYLAGNAVRRSPDVLALGDTNQTYDGTAKPVTVTVEPVGLSSNLTVLYDGSAQAPTNAGTYSVVATVEDDLFAASITGALTIAKRSLTATCLDASRVYGASNPVFTVVLTNFASGDGIANLDTPPTASCVATAASPVGAYSIVTSGGWATNYSFLYSNGTLTVTQAVLTIRADDQERLFGQANPPFSFSYSGWKNNEQTNVLLALPVGSTPADASSPSGAYPITVSGASALNYSFFYIPGTLTVYATVPQITIANTSQTYDGAPKTVTVTTDPAGLAVDVTYNGNATPPVTAGVYAVFARVTETNYSGTNSAVLTILKANQALTAFLPPEGDYPADQLLTLSAAGAPSGIPVSFAIRSGPAEMASSNELRFLDFGPVSVVAWQVADANWNASPTLTNWYSAVETNTVHYAAQAGQVPRWPYANWAAAASNIQVAVDIASPGDTVLVGTGVYNAGGRSAPGGSLTNRLVLEKPILVQAVNGPASTTLAGSPGSGFEAPLGPDAVRCAWLGDGAVLAGFTLQNGFTDGQFADENDLSGGGALLAAGGMVSNCVIAECGAVDGGGMWGGTGVRCTFSGNVAQLNGGGAAETTLRNCLLHSNEATYGGGAFRSGLLFCTLVENVASYGGGAYEGNATNSIVWYNMGGDCFGSYASHTDAGSGVEDGLNGCLTAPPLFLDSTNADFRLSYGSPCINSGDNGILQAGETDLAGAVRPIHAIVDMGAHEFFGTPGVPILQPPSDIRAHQVTAEWQAPADQVRVIHFRIAISNLALAGPCLETLVEAPALSGVATGLAPETPYACRIRAENDYDVSGWSGWQSFTTLTEAAILIDTGLTFNTTYAAGGSLTQVVALANPGATPCAWNGSVSYMPPPGITMSMNPVGEWLTVSPTGGTVPAFASSNLIFTVEAGSMNAGTYAAWHTLTSSHATNSPRVQTVTLHVARATDLITFSATNQVYDGTPRIVGATGLSGEPVSVTYNGSSEPPVDAGLYAITGVVDTANWTAVASAWLTVARAPQPITAFLPASGDVPSTNRLTVSANGGGSGQPVTFSIASGPGALQRDNGVRFSDYGDIFVVANQAGNANWLPASPVTNLYRVVPVPGLTHYVALAGQAPLWPYARWDDAASNIQDGVDAAWDGDAVAVSNGVYQAGGRPAPGGTIANRICVTRPIEVFGVNGADVTVVTGAAGTGDGLDAVRCLYAGTGVVVHGFTLTDGHTAFASDITQDRSGGGAFLAGGAELRHCIVTANSSGEYGGGAFVMETGRVNNCILTENSSGRGGALCLFAGGEAVHCTIVSNVASIEVGGAYLPGGGDLGNAIVWGNRAPAQAPQDLLAIGGRITFTDAGDGVSDGVAGCKVADPLFVPGSVRPAAASPCVDAGNNSRVVAAIDLKGDPRVVGTVDMGAYEYLAKPPLPTDLAVTDIRAATATLHWQPGDIMPVSIYDIELETLAGTNILAEQLAGTVTSAVIAGLSVGSDYRWRVRASNSQGASDWTAWQNFITRGVLLNVTPSSCFAGGGVEILASGTGLGRHADITSVSLCGQPAVILGQSDDWVRVWAPIAAAPCTGHVRVSSPTGGDLVLSNAFSFLPAPAPVLLSPTDITATGLVAHWESLAGAGRYHLQVSASPDFNDFLFESTNAAAGDTSLAVPVLAPGVTNYLRLRAFFPQGYGPFSETLAVPAVDGLPWVRSPIADVLATAGKSNVCDLALVFAGSGLEFTSVADRPGIVQTGLTNGLLTLVFGPGTGMSTVTVTATHTASGYPVSTAFAVEVMPVPLAAIRVNCGGKRVGAWLRDRGYSSGSVFRTTALIDKVKGVPMKVFQDCRFAPRLTYSFPKLPNGTYSVRLKFAELMQNQAGACVFKVLIEGVKVLPRLDVLAKTGGKYRAYRPLFRVTVKDGNGLQIRGVGLDGTYAFFNGIEIVPIPPEGMSAIRAGVAAGTDPDAGPYAITNKAVFYANNTEVTKAMWDKVRAWGMTHGYTDLPEGAGKAADHPVQMVNWYDCVKWCNARSQMEGLIPAYYTTAAKDSVYTNGQLDLDDSCVNVWGGYRLPAETEWEYAARGPVQGRRFPWGDTIGHSNANYFSDRVYGYDVSPTREFNPLGNDGVAPYTCAVGSFGAHGYTPGLSDMAGNVAEWCWDPVSGSNRVVRGGAWSTDASWCRIAQRLESEPAARSDFVGFRAVKSRP